YLHERYVQRQSCARRTGPLHRLDGDAEAVPDVCGVLSVRRHAVRGRELQRRQAGPGSRGVQRRAAERDHVVDVLAGDAHRANTLPVRVPSHAQVKVGLAARKYRVSEADGRPWVRARYADLENDRSAVPACQRGDGGGRVRLAYAADGEQRRKSSYSALADDGPCAASALRSAD